MYKSNVAFQNLKGIVTIDNALPGTKTSDEIVFAPLIEKYPGYYFAGVKLDLSHALEHNHSLDFNFCPVDVVICKNGERSHARSFKATISLVEFARLSKNFELIIGREDIDWGNIEEIDQEDESEA